MDNLRGILERILDRLYQLDLPVASQLQKGLSLQDIETNIRQNSLFWPSELYSLYQWRNGIQEDCLTGCELFPGGHMLSLNKALAEYENWIQMAKQISEGTNLDPNEIWPSSWFPIFTNTAGGDYYVALCNKEQEITSPIYFVSTAGGIEAHPVYDSLTSMMLTIVQAYETGAYYIDDQGNLAEDTNKLVQIIHEYNPKSSERIIGVDNTIETLVESLKHRDGQIRGKAIEKLILLKDKRSIKPLTYLLTDKDWIVRSSAARILGEIGDTSAINALVSALVDKNSVVQKDVVQALGKLKASTAIEPLRLTLQQKKLEIEVRLAVIWTLAELKDPRIVDVLIQLLKNEKGTVRAAAAKALGKMKDRRAVDPLIYSLEDDFTEVRQLAAWALGELGDTTAVRPLENLLQDPDKILQHIVEESLEKIGNTNNNEN